MAVFTDSIDNFVQNGWVSKNNPLYLHAKKGHILLNAKKEFDIPSLLHSEKDIPAIASDINSFIERLAKQQNDRNFVLSTTSSNKYTTGLTQVEKAMQNYKGKAVFWDTESIGVKNDKSWGMTEIAWTNTEGQQGKAIINPFEQNTEADNFIQNALKKVRSGVEGDLTPDERRSLLGLTQYSLDQDGKLVSINKGYTNNTSIVGKVLDEVENGYKILKEHGAKREEWMQQVVDNIIDYRGVKVAHNAYDFDVPLLEKEFAGKQTIGKNYIDTLPLARAIIPPENIMSYTQDDLMKYYGVSMDMAGRHTALGDVGGLKAVFEKMTEKPIDFSNNQTIGAGTVFTSKKSVFRESPYEARITASGQVKGTTGDNLLDHLLIQKNTEYALDFAKAEDQSGKIILGLRNLETDEVSLIAKDSSEKAAAFLEEVLGTAVGTVDTYGDNFSTNQAFAAIFKPNTGYYNVSKQLQIYDAVFPGGTPTANVTVDQVRERLAKAKISASDMQIKRFVKIQQPLAKEHDNLSRMIAGIDTTFGDSPMQKNVALSYLVNAGKNQKTPVPSLDNIGLRVNSALTLYKGDNVSTSINTYVNSMLKSSQRRTSDYAKVYKTMLQDMMDAGLINEGQHSFLWDKTKELFNNNLTDKSGKGIMSLNEMISSTISLEGRTSLYGPYIPSSFDYATKEVIDTANQNIKQHIGFTNAKDMLLQVERSFENDTQRSAFTGAYKEDRFTGIVKKEGTNWGLRKRGIAGPGIGFQFDSDSIEGKLETFITEMQKQGIGVGLNLSDEEDAIRIALFDITKAGDAYKPENIIYTRTKNGKLATEINKDITSVIEIPLDVNGNLKIGNRTVPNIFVPYSTRTGDNVVTTKQEQIVHGLISRTQDIINKIKDNDIEGANNVARRSINRTINGTPTSAAVEKGEKLGILLTTSNRSYMEHNQADLWDPLYTIARQNLPDNASQAQIEAYTKQLLEYGHTYNLDRDINLAEETIGYKIKEYGSKDAKKRVRGVFDMFFHESLTIDSLKEGGATEGKATTDSAKNLVPFGQGNSSAQAKAKQGQNVIPIGEDTFEKSRQLVAKDRQKLFDRFKRDSLVAQEIASGKVPVQDRMLNGIYVSYMEADDTYLFNIAKKSKDFTRKGAVLPTTREDMIVLSPDAAKALSTFQERKKELLNQFEFEDKFKNMLNEAYNTNNDGLLITQDLIDGFNLDVDQNGNVIIGGVRNKNGKMTKRITLKQGDIFQNIQETRLEDGTVKRSMIYRSWRGTKNGTKVISDLGIRGAIIISEDATQAASKEAGRTIDAIIAKGKIKTTNVGMEIGGAFYYIFNEVNNKANKKEKQEIINKLENEYKNTLGQYVKYNKEKDKFIFGSLDGGTDYVSGTVRDLFKLSKEIELPLEKKVMIDGEEHILSFGGFKLGQINDFPYKPPIGFSSPNVLAENSPLRYGSKEVRAAMRNIGEMETILGKDLSEIEKTILGVRKFNATDKVKQLRSDFKRVQGSFIKTRDIQNGTISANDFAKVAVGGPTSEYNPKNIELISEVYNKLDNIDPNIGPGLSKETYMNSTYQKIWDKLDGQEYFVLDFKSNGLQFADNIPDQLVIPKVAPAIVDGTYMPSEVEKGFNNIADAMYEYAKAGTQKEKDTAAIKLAGTIRSYEQRVGKAYLNKESEIVKELTSTRVSNATSFKATGYNVSVYNHGQVGQLGHSSMENTIALSKNDIRKMLTIDTENLSEKEQGKAMKKLKMQLRNLAEGEGDEFIQSIRGMDEKTVIDNIINRIDVDSKNGGKHLVATYNRFPTFSNHDVRYVRLVTSDSIADGEGKISAGLAALTKADFDGDKPFLFLQGFNRDYANYDEFAKVANQFDVAERTQRRVAEIHGQKVIADYTNGIAKNDSLYDLIDTIDDPNNKLRQLINSRFGPEKIDEVFAFQSAKLKGTIGSISIYGSNVKRMLEETAMIGKNIDTNLYEQGKIIEAFTSSLEQNAISSKHLSEKAASGAFASKNELIGFMSDSAEEFFSAVKNQDWDTVGRIGEMVGFFEKDANGQLMLATDHAQMALSTMEATAIEKGLPTEAIESYHRSGIGLNEIKNAYDILNERVQTVYGPGETIKSVAGSAEFTARTANYIARPEQAYTVFQGIEDGSITGMGQMVGDYAIDEVAIAERAAKSKLGPQAQKTASIAAEGSGSARRAVNKAIDASADELMSKVGSKFKAIAPIALGAAGVWALTAAARGPRVDQTPATQEEEPQVYDEGVANQLSMTTPMGAGPTARLTPNTPRKPATVKISAKSVNGLTNEDVFGIIEREMRRQTGTNVNIQMTHKDDREKMDDRWFDQKVSKLL